MIRRTLVALAITAGLVVPATASAVTVVCVPSASNTAITTLNKEGKCEADSTQSVLPAYEAEGIDKKPTARFSGINIQIVNGEGETKKVNGEGNLVIGYDESPKEQTGSHNLVLGTANGYTSYAGILAGEFNSITSPFSVLFGQGNKASAKGATVLDGQESEASGEWSIIDGGQGNKASERATWIGGGKGNRAIGFGSAIFGGKNNEAKGEYEAIP